MLTLLTTLLPLALQLIGLVMKKANADQMAWDSFVSVSEWAQKQNYVSKSLHDSFAEQADRNAVEIEKIKAERAKVNKV